MWVSSVMTFMNSVNWYGFILFIQLPLQSQAVKTNPFKKAISSLKLV